jgi:hypothetical protein
MIAKHAFEERPNPFRANNQSSSAKRQKTAPAIPSARLTAVEGCMPMGRFGEKEGK